MLLDEEVGESDLGVLGHFDLDVRAVHLEELALSNKI